MSAFAISENRSFLRQVSQGPSINWSMLDFRVVETHTTFQEALVKNIFLRGTNLSCISNSEAGKWENRQSFMQKVFEDIIANCPKNEPLVFISLGSDCLLTEYILGKSLIENGFRQISFLLVDPAYAFSEPKDKEIVQKILKDFRHNIESIYFKINNVTLEKDQIRFLSRSQNVAKYFQSNPNVVVIESLPPYAETIKDMRKYQVEVKKPHDLMCGSRIVKSTHANAVTFIPKQFAQGLKAKAAEIKDGLPLAIFQSAHSYFYIDWGCKIQSNGTYHLTFSGEEHYLQSLGISQDVPIKLGTGEVIQSKQWIPVIRKSIEQTLSQEIEKIKNGDSQKQLSQENLTVLLEKVKKIALSFMPQLNCFFSADYMLDREVAMAHIASHASYHYRKAFSLVADVNTGYRISIEEIK